jgi:DNA-binding phage protein
MTPEQQKALALARARKRRAEAEAKAPKSAWISEVRGPDGMTTAERISAAKAGTLAQPSDAKRAAVAAADNVAEVQMKNAPTAVGSFMGNLAPGLTFGFADEIAAGIAAPFSDRTYAEIRDGLRARQDEMMTDQPAASITGQIVGALTPGMAGYKAAEAGLSAVAPTVSAASLPARVGLGAATGAAEGALYGAGTADGKDMAESVKNNALIGGIAGLAAPAAIAGLGYAGRAAWNPISSALNIPSNVRASSAIETMMRRARMTPDDVSRTLREAADEGQPEFVLADALGNAGQRGLSGIARQPGDARTMIAEALTARQGNQGDRLGSFLAEALDAPDTAAARGTAMKAARKAAAGPAYDAARSGAGPVNVSPVVEEIDALLKRDPILGESALGQTEIGRRLLGLRGQIATGNQQLIDFDSVLNVKQDLGGVIEGLKRSGKEVPPQIARVYGQLDEALEAASPAYRAANDDFARASREIAMLDEGATATSPRIRAADTVSRVSGMTDAERRAFAAGYADPLIGKVEASAPGVNKARPLLNNKTKAELDILANDPALLSRRIGRENTMFETNVAALGGSKTADNLADIADTTALSSSVIGNVISGRWGAAAGQLADRLMAGATGSNPATREIIARALLSRDPAAALAPLARRREIAEPVRQAIEAMVRSGALRAQ